MNRTYEYRGYAIRVGVEANGTIPLERLEIERPRYAAVVSIVAIDERALPSPLKIDNAAGLPFSSDIDALMGGYSAARRLIDEQLADTPA
ncbi:hypothetical protein M3I54_17850 [Paraburkholderia sp. CNPSo 3274]|uniref:hypothetical protein n=1 Tax=Paraburkholderia sp. CNPSo 3274 TaxID=2940932 RepID=UPI0020B78009|nr:hypothetical protein [Paraburkholderia sp. CNPSo 3274]MCP3708830.1 hypothetical protein [Paraburkholderia sp. CNPSo 3274]